PVARRGSPEPSEASRCFRPGRPVGAPGVGRSGLDCTDAGRILSVRRPARCVSRVRHRLLPDLVARLEKGPAAVRGPRVARAAPAGARLGGPGRPRAPPAWAALLRGARRRPGRRRSRGHGRCAMTALADLALGAELGREVAANGIAVSNQAIWTFLVPPPPRR